MLRPSRLPAYEQRLAALLLSLCFFARLSGSAATFPLQASANHRFLEDHQGRPFLVVGDTAWSLIAQLDEPSIRRYLDDRAQRGFNAIIVNLIEHKFASHAPALLNGTRPFLEPGDFAKPNPVYFEFAHRVIRQALDRGISVWLFPAYLGWGGGDEGFFKEIRASGPKALRAYGRFLGEHFKDLPNIVWVMGGDFALPRSDRWTGNALAEGLREGGARQLMTAHGGQTTALATFGNQPWLGIDSVYSYQPDLYKPLLADAARQPRRPFVLIETIYEGEHHSTPDQIRRQAWWSILCGATGQFFGNNPIWHFDGPTLFPFKGTWQQALSSAGSRDMARLGRFFRALPWQRLRPKTGRKIVLDGMGSGPNRVIAAATPDGTLAVIYVPSTSTAHRKLTIRLAGLSSPLRAYWFDPAEAGKPGSDIDVVGHDQQVFTTPGDNGAGANDWVLVLETR